MEKKLILRVLKTTQGLKHITIPKNSDIDGGDYVKVEKIDPEKI